MSNTITLLSISDLLGRNFFIPSYQRGYRWDKQQVEELLQDISAFTFKKNKSDKEFYCLQPIVVKPCDAKTVEQNYLNSDLNNNLWYEVIDGQQRLTTIRILITYLVKELYGGKSLFEAHKKHLFRIEYETRKESSNFLDDIHPNDDYIDHFFISEAALTITDWFKDQEDPQKSKEKIRNTFIDTRKNKGEDGIVQVIWYEIENTPGNKVLAIDTFIRINMGKIPLTSSELIKALFLQERDFYKGQEKEQEKKQQNEIAKLKQLQIATEWDSIESALQNDDFWWFINESENLIPARIDFIFQLIKEVKISNDPEIVIRTSFNSDQIELRRKTNPTIEERIGTDSYAAFRYFYKEFDKKIDFETLKKSWDSVQHYYFTLAEWYNNPVWYHYIGFLIFCGERILDIYNLTKYDFETHEIILTKEGITASIKKKIKDRLKNIKWELDSENNPFPDISITPERRKFIRELLLLYNIECIVKQCEAKTLIYKFPFKTFKEIRNVDGNKMSWDVEHIDSYTSNKLPNRKTEVIWLQFALEEIEDTEKHAELISKINDFIKNEKSLQKFQELHQKVIDLIKENENDEGIKDNIGNLTLLDAGTNRGYGNALFPTKRKKIIKKDKLGVFIPICTKNVFLKYFDTSGKTNAKWRIDDIKQYRNDIVETLSDFFPPKPLKVTENV